MRLADYVFVILPIVAAVAAQTGTIWRPSKGWAFGGLAVAIVALAVGLVSLVDVVPASGFVRAIGSPYGLTLRSEIALISLVSSAAISVAWLAILANLAKARRRNEVIRSTRTQHGDARFARWSEVKHMAGQPGFIVGSWSNGTARMAAKFGADLDAGRGNDDAILRWSGAGSMLSFSPPGGGKTSSIVIPTLIDYPGPVVVNDPKGENAAVAVRARRQRGHRVAILNPYGITQIGGETDAINVLDYLRYGTDNFPADCKRLAGAIIEKSKSGTTNPHFEEMALALLGGIIAFLVDANRKWCWPNLESKTDDGTVVLTPMAPLPANLSGIFDFMNIDAVGETVDENLLDQIFSAIVTDKRRIGGRLATAASVAWTKLKESDEKASHFSTLTRFLGCFGDDGVRRASEKSTVDLNDLRSQTAPLDIFVCVPQMQISHCAAFVRALMATITAHIIDGERPPRDVLLLLDEMPALGALDVLMNPNGTGALALGRSAGLRIWAIVQSLSQLRATYGQEGFLTWVGSSSVISCMNISAFDRETSDYISTMLGDFTVEVDDASDSQSGRAMETKSASKSKSIRDAGRRLIRLEEVSKLPDSAVLCFVMNGGATDNRPMLLKKIKYWERPEWAGQTEKNPFQLG